MASKEDHGEVVLAIIRGGDAVHLQLLKKCG